MLTPPPVPRSRFAALARRLGILALGSAVLAAGAAMLVLPGPGLLVIFLGLVVLASEFAWADRAVGRVRHRVTQATSRVPAVQRLLDRHARPADDSRPADDAHPSAGHTPEPVLEPAIADTTPTRS